jgi:hypothetical protein
VTGGVGERKGPDVTCDRGTVILAQRRLLWLLSAPNRPSLTSSSATPWPYSTSSQPLLSPSTPWPPSLAPCKPLAIASLIHILIFLVLVAKDEEDQGYRCVLISCAHHHALLTLACLPSCCCRRIVEAGCFPSSRSLCNYHRRWGANKYNKCYQEDIKPLLE